MMLIEDHAVMRRAMVRLLETAADVVAVADGASALAQLASRRFDLVLMDYRLPDMSGVELLRRLRDAQPAARRVLTSGSTVPDLLRLVRDGLAHDFLLKPVPLEDFLKLFDQPTRARPNARRSRH
jgi:CheY-like chemotaxis protein